MYYVLGYRKKVVVANLLLAFPDKTLAERERIASQFYKNFVDTFIETIKLLSMTETEFDKRCTGDISLIKAAVAKGRSIQLVGGHQFNWEFANLFYSRHIGVPFIGVFANVENKVFNRIYHKFRSKYGTILIPNSSFQRQMIELMKQQYSIILLADQNTDPGKAYWLNFFGEPVPFVIGLHRTAVKNKPVLVYYDCQKLKRGYYHFAINEIVEQPETYTPEGLALKYRDFLERIIHNQPDNYLWSHRRWKHVYNETYRKQWIDTR